MTILIGYGKSDITPPVGTPLDGTPRARLSQYLHDPLWVKALWLENDHGRALLLSIDLVSYPPHWPHDLRVQLAATLPVPFEAIVLSLTHTHAGPAIGPDVAWPGKEAYETYLQQQVIQAACAAALTAIPSRIVYAQAVRDDLSHNRRYVTQRGDVVTHPSPDDHPLYPDGPIDPEIQAIFITDEAGKLKNALVGFACHPTTLIREHAISADYPYWIEQTLKHNLDSTIEMLFFPGALGDVAEGSDPAIRDTMLGPTLAEHLGTELGRAIVEAFRQRAHEIVPMLSIRTTTVQVPTIPLNPARQQWAATVLGAPEGYHEWQIRDARLISQLASSWPDALTAEIVLIALGDLGLYGIPGELFCWYGLQLKSQSQFAHPFIVSLANERIGYIADRVFPSKDSFNQVLAFTKRRFGHQDDAGERIVRAALSLA
jgi:neutral ceramidase